MPFELAGPLDNERVVVRARLDDDVHSSFLGGNRVDCGVGVVDVQGHPLPDLDVEVRHREVVVQLAFGPFLPSGMTSRSNTFAAGLGVARSPRATVTAAMSASAMSAIELCA